MNDRQLTKLSVSEFVQAVASADQPVPAGGSVAALTGAATAALLVLICDVLGRHKPGMLAEQREKAQDLQRQLLELVDEDAAAFRAFLESPRGSTGRQSSAARAAAVPLDISRACSQIAELGTAIAPNVRGAMQLDLAATQQLAQAAARIACDIATYNLESVTDPSLRQGLEIEIKRVERSAAEESSRTGAM